MNKHILILLTSVAVVSSCNTETKETAEVKEEVVVAEEKVVEKDEVKKVEIEVSDEIASAVITSYFQMKDALVKSSVEEAQEAAKALEATAEEHKLSGLLEDAKHIQDTDELDHIREHFELISDMVYKMAKNSALQMPVYKQYCPMAFNNKGAFWLSAEKEVLNPYFGDKMLKCGRVEEEI